MAVAAYKPPQNFRNWADAHRLRRPMICPARRARTPRRRRPVRHGPRRRRHVARCDDRRYQYTSESQYWDLDTDGCVSDDERDEDADGLINYDEVSGRMTSGWWKGCYPSEGQYPIPYAGTKAFDADSDGDGVLDGADDQDFDDVPNIMELSRNMAGNRPIRRLRRRRRVRLVALRADDLREPVQPVPAGHAARGPASATR